MKQVIVVNHPKDNPQDEKKIERTLGEECFITHMRLQDFTPVRLKNLAASCDILLFFSKTTERVKHMFDKNDQTVMDKVRTVQQGSSAHKYLFQPLDI